jgi:hypothetical protein
MIRSVHDGLWAGVMAFRRAAMLLRSQLTDDDARRTEEATRYRQVDAIGCGGCT